MKILMTDKDQNLLCAMTNTPSDLVFWTFRYFLGRMTIATCAFAEDLAGAWEHLDPRIQGLIKKELEEAFSRDDAARAGGVDYKTLGHDCDRAAWSKVRAAYRQHERCYWKLLNGHGDHWETSCGQLYDANDFGCSAILKCPSCNKETVRADAKCYQPTGNSHEGGVFSGSC